jgi:hypothetical protein
VKEANMETLERRDLEPIMAQHEWTKVLAAVLNGITSNEELLRFLARYIQFNSPFGGGVANLAGEIAVKQDLFRDLNEPLAITADRSVEVASRIFFAAIDEFDDRATIQMDTHRTLAQATLKGAGQFFGYGPSALNSVVSINKVTLDAISKVRNGYGVSQAVNECILFRALGFHMGSEILADEEFRLLDGFLRKQYPELVDYLKQSKVEINGVQHVTYYWIRIHTSVEADHFAAAAVGANMALRYYAGQESQEQVKRWILEGFAEFATVQTEFMKGLTEN